ncbi:hypothetical protein D9M68_724980 [compost metagenome]
MHDIIPFDYEGQVVRFNSDGWIDAASASKRFDKEAYDWLRNIDTLEYMVVLADELFGKSVSETPFAEPASQGCRNGKTGEYRF